MSSHSLCPTNRLVSFSLDCKPSLTLTCNFRGSFPNLLVILNQTRLTYRSGRSENVQTVWIIFEALLSVFLGVTDKQPVLTCMRSCWAYAADRVARSENALSYWSIFYLTESNSKLFSFSFLLLHFSSLFLLFLILF